LSTKTKRKKVSQTTIFLILKERFCIVILCQECKIREIELIHHIDGNPENDHKDNLLFLCRKCHGNEHSGNNIVFKNHRMKMDGPDSLSITFHTSEIQFKELMGYNNTSIVNGGKLRVNRIKIDKNRNIQADFDILHKNNKNGFYDKETTNDDDL